MKTRYLLAWDVAEHAAVKIEEFRMKLFAATGCISLRALEPIIPIGYVPEPVTKQDLPDDIPKPDSAAWNTFITHEDCFFLSSPAPASLSDSHLHVSVSGPAPVPVFPGIFIGAKDFIAFSENCRELLQENIQESLTFTPAKMLLVSITFEDEQQWWNDFSYTSQKLKTLR